jgi:uncharacterized repeat protein (TIGR01451 family)
MSLLSRDFLAPFRRRPAPAARSPVAEAEPTVTRARVGGRGPGSRLAKRLQRRRRAPVVGTAEGLERRLALAVVTPFDVRFTANDTGDITFAANTIMTAPGDTLQAQRARAGIPDPILGDQILNDDFWDMAYVDIDGDPTTFNSSAADLVLPSDAEVLFAGLYWGGRARGQTQFDNFGNVKFRGPDDAAYRNLSTTIISSTTQGAPSGSGARNYQSFIDVTDIVQAQGAGTYTTANVQAFAGARNYSAGWSLVVAFREPGAAARNLTVFDGFAYVTTSDPDVTIGISGFQAPPAGPVTGTLGFVAYEGDLGITGDRAFFNGGLGEQQLSNATNPPNNFFNSSISDLGVLVTTKNPDYVNQLGFGADLLAADGLIANSATGGTVRLTTTQDFYYPGVITSAIDLYAPKVSVAKGVTDLDGGEVLAGDTLRYTITVSNAPSALDAAVAVLLEDALPANTTYVPGSLVITAGANAGGKTDAADADQGEYLAVEEAIRFQLGTGAGGALPVPAGGRLAPGESTTVSFDVTIDPDVLAGTIISNTSRASFTAETSRFELFATSNRADVECQPSADLAITKTDAQTSDVPGTGLSYTIVVTNNGPDPVTGATVADTFPAALLGATWTVSYSGGGSGPAGGAGNIATAVNLPALATATFVVTATIDPLATGTLSNTATVLPPAGFTDPNLANNSATDETILTPEADLAVVKTRTSGDPVAGESVTYEIEVTNDGPSTILGFTLLDTTAPSLIGATFGAPSMGSYDPATGAWTGLMLATGQSVTITLTGTVPGVARGDLDNTAVVAPPAGVTDPDLDNNTSIVTDVLALVADLNVVKIRTSGQPVAGEAVTYQITVTNQGPTTIDSFTGIDVTLPDLLTPAYTVSVGSYDPLTGIWTGPALATGGTVVFTLTGTVPADATGTLINIVAVEPPAGVTDPDPSDNRSEVIDEIDLVADLGVVKTRTSGQPVAGLPVTYEIVVTNFGPSSLTSFTGTDTSTPELEDLVFTVNTGSYDPDTGLWTAAPGDTFATGETVTFTLTGTLAAAATGLLVNTATGQPPDGVVDPDLSNNTSTVTDEIGGVSELTAAKTGAEFYKGGGFVNFTVVVTNQGPSFAAGVRVTDALPAGVVSWSWTVSYTGDGSGTADGSPDAVVDSTDPIDKLIDLAVLGTAAFEITALTDEDFESDITNTVVASIGEQVVTASWTSVYDGPINPTQDVGALVVSNDDLCDGPPLVRLLEPETGAVVSQFLAYEPRFRGSVRVAAGDLTGDGIDEIVVAPGRNRVGQIRVFTPEGVELTQYRTFAFGPRYRGGVDVAVGDIDGDGVNEIIASRTSGLTRVNVFGVDPLAVDPVADAPIRRFLGLPAFYRNGGGVTAGDYGTFVNGVQVSADPDGIDEIAVGSNAGIRAQVRVFDAATTPRLIQRFFAFGAGFRRGVTLSTAQWDGVGAEDIVVGAGVGGRSVVEIYGGNSFSQLARLTAFSSFGRPNAAVNTAALDLDGDGIADDLYGVRGRGGTGGSRGVRSYDRITTDTATLPASTVLAPPLRIAPITLRVLG